ncbi:cupin domain-containing protein [Nesterenkonia flava]|uniref:Cupin domain-containing protein n=1 Tax=Nesterenkonia flava TaxID=469799 RepID=A0ABU1FT66_9MICC|nr:cupin domain-containing protein [Nesterenkonia flava]MDR5711839.1 cupin domain-containing protein [Nesterenkonia flava]
MSSQTPPGAEGLDPHPEGGWYRRTYTAQHSVQRENGAVRPAATLIEFFLPPGETSAWHVVESDEIWLWHGPGALTLELGGSGAVPRAQDQHPLDAEHTQVLVPAGVWQRTLPTEDPVRVSCMVSPGFSFEDFTLHAPGGDHTEG